MSDLVKKDDMMAFAKQISNSNLVPKQFQGKPEDIFLAMSWGKELKLTPIQALQNVAVINGKPSIYGDTMIALCRRHPEFEDIKETISGEGSARTAVCEIKRKGQSWYKSQFTMGEAAKAGLLNRQGPWKSYPDRMLKMRARGFALRDVFADALGGMISAEEAQDYPKSSIKDITPVSKQLDNLSKKAIDEPGEASKVKDDTTIGKGKLGHSEAPMAQEKEVQPEDDRSPWEMRKLKGPGIYCESPQEFAEEFSKAMNNIKNHKKFSKKDKHGFLRQIYQINEDTLKNLVDVDSGLHTSLENEYIEIAGELHE
jgi:hypothetical protein